MFLNKTLFSMNYCNMVVLCLSMVEKCSYTSSFFFFCYFFTSSRVRGFSIISLLPSSFEALSKSTLDFGLPTTFLVSLAKCSHVSSHFQSNATNYLMHHKKDIHDNQYLKFHLQFYHPCIVYKLH